MWGYHNPKHLSYQSYLHEHNHGSHYEGTIDAQKRRHQVYIPGNSARKLVGVSYIVTKLATVPKKPVGILYDHR
jgi:hypothetical protein